MSNIIIIDTETIGLPIGATFKSLPDIKDNEKYNTARMLQIAWEINTNSGKSISKFNSLIKPDGWVVKATEIHGITQAVAEKDGKDVKTILLTLCAELKECSNIVGHNIKFDIHIICNEMLRAGIPLKNIYGKQLNCTSILTKKIFSRYYSLSELYKKLFNEELKNAHNAVIDVHATRLCYLKVLKINIG
jgi:DNA polymerase III epsilon subunit-like protein